MCTCAHMAQPAFTDAEQSEHNTSRCCLDLTHQTWSRGGGVTVCLKNPKPRPCNQDDQILVGKPMKRTLSYDQHTNTRSSFFLSKPNTIVPHLPSATPQHCSLDKSASVCFKGRVVHGVAWDRLSANTKAPYTQPIPDLDESTITEQTDDWWHRCEIDLPRSRQPSLSQVDSDLLSDVTINIYQCCCGGLTYLNTADIRPITTYMCKG